MVRRVVERAVSFLLGKNAEEFDEDILDSRGYRWDSGVSDSFYNTNGPTRTIPLKRQVIFRSITLIPV